MSYQVLARKYRPQRFSDVVGQEHVTQTLIQAIRQNRIAHAYIFCGPRGTGKTTIARIFAKCLNCTNGPSVDFDDQDPRCVEITEGRSMDVLEIDGASNNGVEQVRELRETVKYAPATSRFKIYIIDEVHMLTAAAFNALLKTLEEPPSHVKFVFATTDPERVLPTILSRCQRFDLRRIPTALIVQQLARIAQAEKVEVELAALHAIARGCDGGMRDAESALDQLISFCGNKIVEADVLSMYGLTAQAQLLSLAGAILEGDAAKALNELDAAAHAGKDLGRLLGDLLRYFRNLLIYKVTNGDRHLLEASETEMTALAGHAKVVTADAALRIMDVLSQCEQQLREAASRKILLELALVKAIEMRQAVSLDTVLKQLQQLRSEADQESPPASAISRPVPPTASGSGSLRENVQACLAADAAPRASGEAVFTKAPTAAPPAPAPPVSFAASLQGEALDQLWNEVMAGLANSRKSLHIALQSAFPVSLVNEVLTVGFPPDCDRQRELAEAPNYRSALLARLKELGAKNPGVKFIQAEAPASRPTLATAGEPPKTSTPPVNPVPKSLEDFLNDPKIAKALELFSGTLSQMNGSATASQP